MRTTIKRGIGRAEANGRPALPPAPPLSPLTQVTRYGPRRRSRWHAVGRFFLWLLVAIIVAVGALAGGAWLFINQSVSAVRPHSPGVIAAQEALDVPAPGKPTVALVIGYDKRNGVDKSAQSRSDTLMLLRADPDEEAVTMLSFPRDLVVDHPGCPSIGPFSGRINEAYTYCKEKGALKTVKELTGIPINYMITVNFRGFVEMVDRLGGVYMDIDQRYFNDISGPGGYATIDLRAGYQRLTGREALDFVRFRHTDSDLYRVVRQQQFVKAMKQQISSTSSITKIPGIVNTITNNVEVAKGGSKELDPGDVLGYAKLAYGLPAGNFQQVQIEGLSGYNELAAPEGAIETAVEEFLHPDVEAPERAVRVATGQPPRKEGPPPSSVTLRVLNGNGVAGAADDVAVQLGSRGYVVENGGNAERFDYFRTQVLYDSTQEGADAAARAVADIFGDADVEPAPAGASTTMLTVIVGKTFLGTLSPEGPADSTPEYEPPAVVKDPATAAPLVRQVRRKVDFRVLFPTVREENSALDSTDPIRVYGIDDHRAMRLVYRTGTGEYWGIQQTSWTDAPILDGASVTRRIGKREYRLFFNRSKLHLVAFEANGAVYWVVNTLLERLSNETMLAIAKGLKSRPR